MIAWNFPIHSPLPISQLFREEEMSDFDQACSFIRNLPYRRNKNKNDLASVFKEQCGTCSTKHAILKQLAVENGMESIQLMIGIYKMNVKNTPPVGPTLEAFGLEFIPEAHCYLKRDGMILDCTKQKALEIDFGFDLMDEHEILPEQIGLFKVEYHQQFIKKWLSEYTHIPYGLNQMWDIREQCIKNLEET